MDILNVLISIVALPAALYFMALLAIGFFSRLAFDALAVLSFMFLLMSWLASSGLDALVLFLMVCTHAVITAFARSRLPSLERSFQRSTGQVDGGS
ncbi:hypothetical protein [Stenotrophomonas sp. Iso1]|uniref:hypothetical protein n=1 Tax=Stenotrophomonas sp. Iso1 TaxID=2977283 RepID=UPI0022B77446|nr:hypothetical protein [Stenotrophomonas sp. Iso1]